MALLRSIEAGIESLFEGIFGRAFRTHVQPIELARKLVKEMDDHRSVSVSRVYVPNEYTVYLSPHDRRQFAGYEESLVSELQEYLAEHARREDYALLTPPRVVVTTDDDLAVGEFGIATRMAADASRPQPTAPPPPAGEEPAHTMIYRAEGPPETAPAPDQTAQPEATFLVDGKIRAISKPRIALGRSRQCDVYLTDANVSRRHAEVVREGSEYWLADLGSTNGTQLNGERIKRARLSDGDVITLGSTEVVFGRSEE